ncbi:MAG: hypothetical protein AAGC55_20700, partial [Myxococcota bacterium]
MFENYVGAKTQKRRKWVSALIGASVLIHVAVVLALLIHGYWVVEKLALPKGEVTIAVAPPPPPPPPPAKKATPKKVETKKV